MSWISDVMWRLIAALVFLSYGAPALYEGDTCSHNGVMGTCKALANCDSVKQDIQNKRSVQTCGFDDSHAIVCCLDADLNGPVKNLTVATTIPPRPSTTEYIPPSYDYENPSAQSLGLDPNECPPVPPAYTSPRTGQKAWDKCLEYQERLVYPCENGDALDAGDSKTRRNYCHNNVEELIINKQANKFEFSHMVLLGYGDDKSNLQWICAGSLISETFVLSAAHCIFNRDTGNVSHVYVGAHKRSDTRNLTNIYRVKTIHRHPLYRPPSKYHDITLLELDREVPLSQYVVPACLHVGDAVEDSRVVATGWGLANYKRVASETLQKVFLSKFTTSECSEKFPATRKMDLGFDENTQTCYGDKGQSKDICEEDSGGPIQIKSKKIYCMYVIVGVSSVRRSCGFIGDPVIYTLVSAYVPWIESIVWP